MAMVGGARSAVAVAIAARCWRFRSKKAAAPVFLRPFSGAPNGRLLPICQGFRTRVKAPIIKSRREIGFGRRASNLHSRSIASEVQETITGAGVVNESTFKKLVLESDIPVLVDFWAPWCGPCRMIAPLIDEMARQYAGKLRCLKINTDECPQIATDYGIRSIPTVMVFVGGEKKETVIGAVPKSTLTATVEKYLEW